MLKACPGMKWRQSGETFDNLYIRVDKSPFSDIRVRRALHMAIDYQTWVRNFYAGHAEILYIPVPPTSDFEGAYTPFKELPESTKELYEFHPDKAKQLLTEAGYPNGFKFSVLCHKDYVDVLSIMADYFAKIGVDMQLDVKEQSIWQSMRSGRKYEYAVMSSYSLVNRYNLKYFKTGGSVNQSIVSDPILDEAAKKANLFEMLNNPTARNQVVKEYGAYLLGQAYVIPTPGPYEYTLWWPWVKNYYGIHSIGATNEDAGKYIWIDQELKKYMGH